MLPIIFIIALLVNLLIETTESFTVVVPRDQTVARVGSTVTLPCWISPPENAEVLEIRWYRQEFSNPVLLYQNGKIIQEESFRNRSSLTLRSDQSGGLKDGDVSLRLEKLTVQDEGSFRCYVSGESVYDSRELVLKVIALGSAPVLFPQPLDDGRVNISCKSSGWYPEPDVSWTSDERTVLRPGGVSRSRGADEMFSVHSWTAVSHSDAQLVSCSISLKTGELREGRLSIKAIISSDPPDSSDPWMALFIIAFICVLGLIGFILYKYRHKLTGKKAVKKVCDDETMESLTKVRDDESMERGTKEDAGSSSSCAGAAAPHVHSQPSERKKTIKKVCDDETMESLTKVRDDESMERGTKEDAGSSSSCAGAAAPHVHSQPSERKKTIKKICEDETMESLTKVRDDESMERETKEAVKDTNTEEQKKDTVGEHDSSNQEEKPTGLSPDQTSPSADAGSSSWCAGAAAPHVHSQPSESVGDTNIAELRKHAVEITIDPKRSHPGLTVSKDRKTVRDAPDYKHTGEGFPYELCAVGAQRFTSGRHYWEVELALEDKPPKNYWLIGVTKLGNFRAKDRSAVTSNRCWFLCSDGDNGFYISSDPKCNPPVSLSLTPRPERLGVLLDYGEGQLSFYNVKERKHVLTMSIRFPGAVTPLFNPGVGDQSPLMILDCPKPVETPVESSDPLLGNSSDA
ncbi:selection and upkeep of intraepithelial T-cells protein 5-like isoform X21 [Pimephales promelas]|uniref:selection and upkeep of intraepithelial T-cells protein 5-like isoform X21 n=1 Tax=Pimephales promelas TaxID=90988 RepID=UPI001955B995|nr:selection and upkeep of intraepithelial T-cells protein 5-like isoform X21 [Pimephales promelas]